MKLKKIFIMSFMLTVSSSLWAHGYIKSPASRAYKCAQGINKTCGDIKYEPQSVEQRSGFPDKDFPEDGKLASGGIQRFGKLDEAGENRWHKTQMQVGDNIFLGILQLDTVQLIGVFILPRMVGILMYHWPVRHLI